MKISISLSDADAAYIDEVAQDGGFPSRSAVIQHALARLRAYDLQGDYAQAWTDWTGDGDDEPWESVARDGLGTR